MRIALASLVSLVLLAGCTPPPVPVPMPVPVEKPSVPPPSEVCAIRADIAVPPSEGDVEVAVFNGSGVTGLGQSLGADMAARGFKVVKVASERNRSDAVAVLRFGPAAVGRATLVNAHFLGRAQPRFDIARQGKTVDVVVGAGYRQLASTTEKNQALAMIGLPQAPPGTCADVQS